MDANTLLICSTTQRQTGQKLNTLQESVPYPPEEVTRQVLHTHELMRGRALLDSLECPRLSELGIRHTTRLEQPCPAKRLVLAS